MQLEKLGSLFFSFFDKLENTTDMDHPVGGCDPTNVPLMT